jgi:hypothetical protein
MTMMLLMRVVYSCSTLHPLQWGADADAAATALGINPNAYTFKYVSASERGVRCPLPL